MAKTVTEKPSSTPITGKALLQKVKDLGNLPRSEVARLCGQYTETKDHKIRAKKTEFYDALLAAKGIDLEPAMRETLDVTGLTPEQIEQIDAMINTFRGINKHQHPLTEDQISEFDPTELFFESEILQPFNRSLLYGNRI